MYSAWGAAAKAAAVWVATACFLVGCNSRSGSGAGVVDIQIEPQGLQLVKGTTAPLKATALYSDGFKEDVSALAEWESADPAIATVGVAAETGRLIYGTEVGTTQVTARYSGFDAAVTVSVSAAVATSLAISPGSLNQPKGTGATLTARATFSDGTSQDVTTDATWTSSDPAVAAVGDTIGSKGALTAVDIGTATITAAFQSLSAEAAVTVTGAAVSLVEVAPAAQSIAKGTAQQFAATALFTDGTTQDVTAAAAWTSSDTAIAEVGDAAGTKGLAQGVGVGEAQIRATYLGETDAGTLTVTAAALTGVEIAPIEPTIAKGTTQQFVATAVFADGTKQDVTATATWASSDQAVATVSNAGGSSGRADGIAQGTTEISVTYNEQLAATTLTVTAAVITSIGVTPANPSIAKGTQQQFTATAVFSDDSTQDITTLATWTSSDTAVASVGDSSASKGLATGVAQGSTQIGAAYQSVTGATTLTVTAAAVTSVQVTPENPSIAKGTTQQFTATATFSDASTQDVTASATWSSSNTSVASISNASGSKGRAQGASPGESQIAAAFGGLSGATTLTVTPAVITELQVAPTSATIAKGTSQQFTATAVFSDSTTQNVTADAVWRSSNTNAATVSNASGSNGRAQGVGTGTADITATYQGQSAQAVLTVSPAVVTSVDVTPANPSIAKGTQQQFTATAVFSDATTQDVTADAAWTSDNTNVASISNADGSEGLASGTNAGSSTIRASYDGVAGTTTLTVTPAVVTALQVTPADTKIAKGTSQQFTATATFSDSSTQIVTASADWSSSDTGVATVSNAAGSKGLAQGKAVGKTIIKASYQGKTASATLEVTAAVLSQIQVTPTSQQIPIGRTQQYTATGVYTDGTTQNLTASATWATSNAAVLDISNAASTKGLAAAKSAGNATISATQEGKTGDTTAQVVNAALDAIQISPTNARLAAGYKRYYTATGVYSDGSSRDITGSVTWGTSAASIATISNAAGSKGVATGVAAGIVSVSAQLDGVTKSTQLTVTSATLQQIQVTPVNQQIPLGTAQQYTATAVFSDNSSQDFTNQVSWVSTTVATATIDAQGKAQSVAKGETTIRATYVDTVNGNTEGSTSLTVTDAALVSIAVDPSSATIAKGRKTRFKAIGSYTSGPNQDITETVSWTSSNTGVATVSNAAGSRGEATGVATGNATITAALSGKSGTAALTVSAAALDRIDVSSTQGGNLPKGRTRQYAAQGTYSDQTTRSLTADVLWASSNENIATISNAAASKGLAKGEGVGTVDISASLDGVTGKTPLTVSAALLESIAITPVDPSVPAGLEQQFTATGSYSDGSTSTITDSVTWASSNTAVAEISNSAGSHGRAFTKAAGSTTISATDSATSVTKSTTLKVTSAVLQAIVIKSRDPAVNKPLDIPVGFGVEFIAEGQYSDGVPQDITEQVSWNSLAPTIVKVGDQGGVNKGYANALAIGSTTIRAVLGSVEGTSFVKGVTATLTSIDVTPNNPSSKTGETVPFKATAVFGNGGTYDITREATWTSSNQAVATISNDEGSEGQATALAQGTTTIKAASGTVSDTTTLTNSLF